MRGKRIKVILNPDRQEDRRILDYLLYSGTSNSRAIKKAVLSYLDSGSDDNGNGRFLQEVKDAIRESVQGLQIAPAGDYAGTMPTMESDEEPVSMLDFLDELEKGASFYESGPPFSP